MKITAPIVGMSFRPPANRVLAELPFGTPLLCRRQPDNQYDSNAIQVLLPEFSPQGKLKDLYFMCEAEALPDELPAGRGLWNKGVLSDPLFLGFIAAKSGEAGEISAIMDRVGTSEWSAELCGTLEGKPAVQFELEVNTNPGPMSTRQELDALDDEIPF